MQKRKNNNNMPKRCFADGILAENDVIDLKTISYA